MHYYGVDNTHSYYLAHYGVLGMKWGVRHDQDRAGGNGGGNSSRYTRTYNKVKDIQERYSLNPDTFRSIFKATRRKNEYNARNHMALYENKKNYNAVSDLQDKMIKKKAANHYNDAMRLRRKNQRKRDRSSYQEYDDNKKVVRKGEIVSKSDLTKEQRDWETTKSIAKVLAIPAASVAISMAAMKSADFGQDFIDALFDI